MLRCHDRGGWVDIPGQTPDPDDVDEALQVLFFNTGTVADAYWPLIYECDADERLKRRAKQRAYMARYGAQPILSWDNVDVMEFEEYYAEIAEIIAQENKAANPEG